MEKFYFKGYSHFLDRDMEFNVYGRTGKPVLVFPCQNGRFYDWEGFGMMDTLGEYIDSGKIQLFCVDTIDSETLSNTHGNPYHRIRLHEAWYNYIMEELISRIQTINHSGQKLLTTGFSMGAYHAANFFFRRPDVFDSVIALSGMYDTEDMYNGYMDDVVYKNDPCVSIANMPENHPYIEMFNNSRIIICVGQGAWEDQLLASTRKLDGVLRSKGINAWVDYWGFDVNHDWPWWKKQILYFLPYVLE